MSELKNLKNALNRRVACVLAVSIACLSMSCTPQKAILVQQKTVPVQSVKIDTCFVFHRDTAFVVETDTFRIETLIRDTLISQHIETKPYYITTTDTIYIEQDEQKTEVKQAKQERNMAAALFIFVCLLLFFLAKTLKK